MNNLQKFILAMWATLQRMVKAAGEKRLAGLSAEIAFNATLALFPTILALLSTVNLLLAPSRTALRQMARHLAELAPLEVVLLIRNFVESNNNIHHSRLISLSFLVALWISSNAMATAMMALDQIQQIPFEHRRSFWQTRAIAILLTLISFSLYIGASLVVFISEFLIQFLAGQVHLLGKIFLGVWWVLTWPIALGLVTCALALIYRFGPSHFQYRTPIFPGAFLGALSWAIVSSVFRNYVSHFGRYRQIYGALGAAIVLMMWLYWSAFVMLLGNQFNVSLAKYRKRWQ
jgi:membrane protein